MVKGVVWAMMGLAMIGSVLWGIQMVNSDQGQLLGMAVTGPDDQGNAEVQVLVPMVMKVIDPPPMGPNFKPDWDTWLDQHFDLRDAAGTKMVFKKGGLRTKHISEAQSGTAEFIALATITAGQPYTLNYTPVVGEPEKYVKELDGNEMAYKRATFVPNY